MSTRILALLLVILLYPAGRLGACECAVSTICERLDQTPVIFLGEVIDGGVAPGEDPWYSTPGIARLRVIEAFRGIPNDAHEIDIDLFFIGGMCAPNLYLRGKQVLVFTDFDESTGVLSEMMCTLSVSGERLAEELDDVRRYFRGEMKTEIHGRIAPNTRASSVDFVLSMERTPPLAGATVVAEAHGQKYQAVSDAAGKYSIAGLPGGVFQVHAELPGFENREGKRTVQVKEGSCAVQNFGLWASNSVDGFVYDQNGAPVPGVRVHVQRAGSKQKVGKESTTNIQGAFRFGQIDPGEYSVVVSPAGATAKSSYPRTTSVAPIQVGSTSTIEAITLTLPPPIPTRNIRIHVTGPDGKPLTEGHMTCAQAGRGDEGYPMSEGLSPKPGGAICSALSDRVYRIRLVSSTTRFKQTLPNAPEALVLPGRDDTDVHLKLP